MERTETVSPTPTSSRSSKCLDPSPEHIDILGIHSVVQAFFIEMLSQQREQYFWAERAARVLCRSIDEADRKIQDDPKIGNSDDYRRFAIHGRRLLEHLHRYQKRGPEYLSDARQDVEHRLRHINDAVRRLSLQTQTRHSLEFGGEEGVAPTSVFERAGSLSETDSATPSSHRSLTAKDDHWGDPAEDEDGTCLSSPETVRLEDANPYHFHVPYPQGVIIPAPDSPGERGGDDDLTEVPMSRSRGPSPPSRNPMTRTSPPAPVYRDWQGTIGPRHRTVEKHEARRYHDRGGAWRNQGVGDPRISVSRESAKGSVSAAHETPRALPRPRMTAESEAELRLNKIKQHWAGPMSGGTTAGVDQGRTDSGTSPTPRLILASRSFAEMLAGKASEPDPAVPVAESSSGFLKSPAATLRRLKETLLPMRPNSTDGVRSSPQPVPGMAIPQPGDSRRQRLSPPNDHTPGSSPPTPMFRGSRTASSSPGPAHDSYYAPPTEALHDSPAHPSRRAMPAAAFRHWETRAYHPGLGHVDSSDLRHGVDPTTLSCALDGSARRYFPRDSPPPLAPDGYTSEPMSRDPSGQSPGRSAVAASRRRARDEPQNHRRQLSSPGALPRSLPGSRLAAPPRTRSPSFVETEPSPRIGDAFPDVHTSYERWEERRDAAPGRSRLRSVSPGQRTRARRRGRAGGGGGRRAGIRPHSHSPGPAAEGKRPTLVDLDLAYAPPASGPGAADGGQEMARTGSLGGMKLSDGRVIDFGQSAVDLGSVRHGAWQREAREISPDGSFDDSEDDGADGKPGRVEGEDDGDGGAVGLGLAGPMH